MDWITHIDLSILHMIVQYLHTPWLNTAMVWLTKLGDSGAIWIALVIYLLINKTYRKAGLTMLVALVIGVVVCNLGLKPMIGRLRPFLMDPSLQLLMSPPSGFSFPSGHTWSSFAIAVVAMMHRIKGRYIVLGAAMLMAFSRLYLTVHYPTDVIGGIVIGFIIGYGSVKLVNPYLPYIKLTALKLKSKNRALHEVEHKEQGSAQL